MGLFKIWDGTSWVLVNGIEGPTGPQGPTGPEGPQGPQGIQGEIGPEGPQGPEGSVWRDGTGAPSDTLGVDGDYYLDTSTGDVYVRAAGVYSVAGNIEGPQGPAGNDGVGIPVGGSTGQILSKATATDYDTAWISPPEEGTNVQVSGQTGGTDGKVIRHSAADTWVDASQADTIDQLTGLLFKQSGNYYPSGSVVSGLTGLTAGSIYYLSTAGDITATAPTPSATVRSVVIGKAINTTTLLVTFGTPIGGE